VDYLVRKACLSPDSPDMIVAMSGTDDLAARIVAERYGDTPQAGRAKDSMLQQLAASLTARIKSGSKTCPLSYVVVRRSISAKNLLRSAGIENAFLGAFERTLFQSYEVGGFKFAPYVPFDPYASQSIYLESVRAQVNQTFLQLWPPPERAVRVFEVWQESVPEAAPRLQIPFSPMLASSLTVTIFFILYLLYLVVLRARDLLLLWLGRALPRVQVEKGLFTALTVVITLMWAAFLLLFQLFELVWNLITSSW
jgi:hypothetical protein